MVVSQQISSSWKCLLKTVKSLEGRKTLSPKKSNLISQPLEPRGIIHLKCNVALSREVQEVCKEKPKERRGDGQNWKLPQITKSDYFNNKLKKLLKCQLRIYINTKGELTLSCEDQKINRLEAKSPWKAQQTIKWASGVVVCLHVETSKEHFVVDMPCACC